MPHYRTMMEIVVGRVSIEHAINIEYRYTPGSPAYTPPGEYGPIDPPEPAETDIGTVTIVDAKTGVETLAPDWLVAALRESDEMHRELCDEGEEAMQPDPDAAYDAMRDDRDFGHGSHSEDPF